LIEWAAVIIGSYLIGSIPSGIVLGKLRGLDVREYGSGKTGTTNVLRTMGTRAGSMVLAADLLKGVIAVIIARYTLETNAGEMAAGFAAIAGHDWSVFIRFQGGRGVATSEGALLTMAPLVGAAGLAIFVGVIALTRYVSLGSISATWGAFIIVAIAVAVDRSPAEHLIYIGIAAALITWQHRDNIRRLIAGSETKLGQKGAKRQVK